MRLRLYHNIDILHVKHSELHARLMIVISYHKIGKEYEALHIITLVS